jgi:hypothetical protein
MAPWIYLVPGLRAAAVAEGVAIIILGGLKHYKVDHQCHEKPAVCFYGPYVHGAFLIIGSFVTLGFVVVVSSYYKLLRAKVLVASVMELDRPQKK